MINRVAAAIRADERERIVTMLKRLEGGRFREDVKLGISLAWSTIEEIDHIIEDIAE